MSNRYLVKCPNCGSDVSGNLPDRFAPEFGHRFAAAMSVVTLQCSRCHHKWHARAIGDDLAPLPFNDQVGYSLEPVTWPLTDIGVGD